MNSLDAASAVINALDAVGVPYMLVGSLSTNVHGVPRATQDADFVIALEGHSIRELEPLLAPAFRLDPQMSFETATMTTRFKWQSTRSPFSVELFLLGDDPHDRERFGRRIRVDAEGLPQGAYCATAEDAIITKLRWSRNAARAKDVEDVRNMLAVQSDAIDWAYVHSWCDQHGTREILDRIRASLPTP
jgi:hypothetical protein